MWLATASDDSSNSATAPIAFLRVFPNALRVLSDASE
jgi:hypothetical protein